MRYQIDMESDTPRYQQLAEAIYRDILDGTLAPGTQLPPARELAQELDLATGTIKRSYEELAKCGMIEMRQGRGSFVRSCKPQRLNRKEQAMVAIDELLRRLDELSFTPTETELYLNLKLREHTGHSRPVQLALVDGCAETLGMLSAQLCALRGVEVQQFLLRDLPVRPFRPGEDADLVIVPADYAGETDDRFFGGAPMEIGVPVPTSATLMRLARLGEDARLGIVCAGTHFADLALHEVRSYSEARVVGVCLLGEGQLEHFATQCDVLLLPDGARVSDPAEADCLRRLREAGRVLDFACGFDRGSMLHIERRVRELRSKRLEEQPRGV